MSKAVVKRAAKRSPREPIVLARPSPRALERVALLGIGKMGRAMAARLIEKGAALSVFNRTFARAHPLAKLGARVALTPAECVQSARFILTSVTDAAALDAILDGPNGVCAAIRASASSKTRPIVIDTSTVGRKAAVAAAARVKDAGGHYIDAPMSGTVGPATKGELVALVGGDPRVVDRASALFAALCKRVILAGAVGQGQALKTVLNGVGAHHLVAFASMLALGERAGLSRSIVVDAFASGAFATPSYVGKKAKIVAQDFTPEFSLALARKDCALSAALATEVGLDAPVQREVLREIDRGVLAGIGDLDLFALEKLYSET